MMLNDKEVMNDMLEDFIESDAKKLERRSVNFEEVQFLRGRIDVCRLLKARLSDANHWEQMRHAYEERLRNA